MLRALVLLALLLALAGCGGGSRQPAATTHDSTPAQCPATRKALAKIRRDLEAIRAAAKLPVKDTLMGNHPINVATDRFLRDIALAPISNLQRNRLIDHAASALVGNCQQCFQALEAERPIPAIRAGESKCPTA